MTNEEFRKQINSRTDDLISQIKRHDQSIANIVKNAYERGYADGKRNSNSNNMTQVLAYEYGKLSDRPKGEWIIIVEDGNGIHKILCPFCKCEKGSNFMDHITVTFENLPPFCESCGADMRGDING